ncbi:imidazole glycerol phosphate synthase subunit HisH [Helicobacter winghamensis]|uniref:Imidazole glycerol phosphate synthase subunit HisH n=1 Tax=Helicobacter winghamensis TaxID=157268 RepID=A0A2N3PII8_9HELI|nr:imidazole glycerol phosphate synthase subunit HisH [Helicobacter winghamensis]EEO25631.1 imidazole glycerol phosphate synthase, glutamine amidotransferase subunit [Helicobacter winghamensis ATCC BAA-430]PKT76102.1 imidazole glycerol phosphate synthase, glutamine amidotransferase subunit [Helicobacter winghamensis]PKT76737.1 imidazole glycerol phosphate synthase, glutamine amidotransferase subunit [Helicobacter winghamensis]PKT76858.1 imidazole glycerol phosphate synthase, glutamine amidotran
MLGIVNYQVGNLASVKNAVLRLGEKVEIESNPYNLKNYDRLILPGVGAFGDAMEHLRNSGMQEAVLEFVKSGKPLLGICLGMQLLFQKSYEFGEHFGLGLLEGEVVKFNFDNSVKKIPHMGWNVVHKKMESPLLQDLDSIFYLYFVHSFYVKNLENAVGVSNYGVDFASIVQKENIFGIQPHPEKSHNVGLRILKNFIEL